MVRAMAQETGQVIVLVALLMTALMSVAALAVDVGIAYQARRNVQTGADAAALAGVMDMAEGRAAATAQATAKEYAAQNIDGVLGGASVSFPQPDQVRVAVNVSKDTIFARIMGNESMPVAAEAIAAYGSPGSIYNLMPLIVPHQRINGHVGEGNTAVFELGEDRPMDELSIIYSENGSLVTYTVTYINSSNKTVALEVWTPVPAGADYLAGSATGAGVFDGTDVRWQWAGVAAGDSRSAAYIADYGGPVSPSSSVYVSVDGGPIAEASTAGAQLGFFWLTDFNQGSQGTQDFADWIINGYPGAVGVGDLANGTGTRAALKSAMATRIATDPSVILPLYDRTENGGSNGTYHVVGFAEFVITDFEFTGNPKSVTGYFTNGTVTPGAPGGPEAIDYGVRAIWLVD